MSVDRAILRLALPSIVSNITVPLLGMADTAIVGHMGNAAFIAAISLGTTAFSMIYWVFSFLRMSTSGLVAQAYGARDKAMAADVMRRSLALSIGIALFLLICQQPLFRVTAFLMHARTDVLPYLHTYFFTAIWGAPSILLNYSLSGWFIGQQDTRTPMWAAILQNIANILLSLYFVYGLHGGIAGVAWGTVSGTWTGTLFMIFRLNIRLLLKPTDRKVRNHLLSTNVDIFLRTLCLVCVTVFFTRAGSMQVQGILEANTLLMQFFVLFSFFADGFANAGEALAGNYQGANDKRGLRTLVRHLHRWGLGMALCFVLLYTLSGPLVLSFFTNQSTVRNLAINFLPWLCLLPLTSYAAFIWDGIFIGLTRSRQMLWSMLAGMFTFFLLWFTLHPLLNNHALWLAFDAYLGMRGLAQWKMTRSFQELA